MSTQDARRHRWHRRKRPWRLIGIAGTAAATLLVASCTGAGGGSGAASAPSASVGADASPAATPGAAGAAEQSPPPSPEPPPETGCRQLAAADLRSIVNEDPTVPCRRRHTVVTFHVGELPEALTTDASSPSSPVVEAAADRACERRFDDYVGGDREDRALSMLASTYFLPSAEQFSLGAGWVRCDAYAYATRSQLTDLPRRLEDVFERDEAGAELGKCSRFSPSHPRFTHVVCERPHGWRAATTQRLGGRNEQYPGRRTVQGRARERCEGQVRDYLGTQEAFSYGFEVPRRAAWADGERFGLCWARTSE